MNNRERQYAMRREALKIVHMAENGLGIPRHKSAVVTRDERRLFQAWLKSIEDEVTQLPTPIDTV